MLRDRGVTLGTHGRDWPWVGRTRAGAITGPHSWLWCLCTSSCPNRELGLLPQGAAVTWAAPPHEDPCGLQGPMAGDRRHWHEASLGQSRGLCGHLLRRGQQPGPRGGARVLDSVPSFQPLSCTMTWARVAVPVLCPSRRKLRKLVYALQPWEPVHALAEMRLRGSRSGAGPWAKVQCGKEQSWPDCSLHFCHKQTQGRQGAANSNTGDGEAPAGTPETGGTMHRTQRCSPGDERELCWATAGI